MSRINLPVAPPTRKDGGTQPTPTIGRMPPRPRSPLRPLAATAAALLCTVLLASCGSDGDETAFDTGESESTVACEYASDGSEPAKPVDAPGDEAPDTGDATAVITTGAGD